MLSQCKSQSLTWSLERFNTSICDLQKRTFIQICPFMEDFLDDWLVKFNWPASESLVFIFLAFISSIFTSSVLSFEGTFSITLTWIELLRSSSLCCSVRVGLRWESERFTTRVFSVITHSVKVSEERWKEEAERWSEEDCLLYLKSSLAPHLARLNDQCLSGVVSGRMWPHDTSVTCRVCSSSVVQWFCS